MTDLFQWSVWHSKAAQPHVCQCLLQLSEQAGVRTMFESPAGQQEGQLLSYDLYQFGLWDVMVDEGCYALYVPWESEIIHPKLWSLQFDFIDLK